MKKIVLAMAAASVVGFSASAQAASTVCVFDLLGKAGDSSLYTTNFTEPLSYQDSAFLKLPKFP